MKRLEDGKKSLSIDIYYSQIPKTNIYNKNNRRILNIQFLKVFISRCLKCNTNYKSEFIVCVMLNLCDGEARYMEGDSGIRNIDHKTIRISGN